MQNKLYQEVVLIKKFMKIVALSVLFLVAASGLEQAYAGPVVVRFSFTYVSGDMSGIITGRILGLRDDMSNQAAGAVVIDSVPDGFGSFVGGMDVTGWDSVLSNSFTVVHGVVTYADFTARQNGGTNGLDSFQLAASPVLSNNCGFVAALRGACGQSSGGFRAWTGSSSGQISPIVRTQTDFLVQAVAPAPEPATLLLLGTGLVGLGLVGTRRRQA